MRSISSVLAATLAFATVASAKWSVVSPSVATIVADVSFTNETTGYAPAGQNGGGAEILKTTSSGQSWNTVYSGGALMYLAGAATGQSVVVAGPLTLKYSVNGGRTFNDSAQHSGFLGASQSVSAVDNSFFGAAGSGLGGGNGVAVSSNGGKDFTFFNITALKTESRYVSMVSKDVWYISAGEWPEQSRKELVENLFGMQVHHRLSSRLAIAGYDQDASNARVVVFPLTTDSNNANDDGGASEWQAQIVKTTDGGKTFESVFWDEGNFYFNQISCADEDNCCAVGESDAGPAPGVRIHCTNDGGKNWKRTFFTGEADLSVMAVEFVTSDIVWAAGGRLSSTNFEGFFWQSTDGGNTWSNETVPGVYGNHMSFPSESVGYASSFDRDSQSSILQYTA